MKNLILLFLPLFFLSCDDDEKVKEVIKCGYYDTGEFNDVKLSFEGRWVLGGYYWFDGGDYLGQGSIMNCADVPEEAKNKFFHSLDIHLDGNTLKVNQESTCDYILTSVAWLIDDKIGGGDLPVGYKFVTPVFDETNCENIEVLNTYVSETPSMIIERYVESPNYDELRLIMFLGKQ